MEQNNRKQSDARTNHAESHCLWLSRVSDSLGAVIQPPRQNRARPDNGGHSAFVLNIVEQLLDWSNHSSRCAVEPKLRYSTDRALLNQCLATDLLGLNCDFTILCG